MTDILSQKFKPSGDAFATAVGNETVLLQVKSGIYYGLDEIGTQLWEGIKRGSTPLETCQAIAAECAVSLETVKADARAFLEDLKAHDIIVPE